MTCQLVSDGGQEGRKAIPATRRISLYVDLAAADDASLWLRETGKACGLSPEDMFRVDLCVSELVTNIVRYAGTEPGAGTIDISTSIDKERVAVEVRDNGRPFDPLSVAALMGASTLADAVVGGYGIHLVRSFAHEVRYDRCGGENVIAFVVRRSRPVTQGQ